VLIVSLQYTYYTITAFNVKVPNVLKRSLTSLQITQFIFGASAAMINSFIYYTIPVKVPVASSHVSMAAGAEPTAGAGLIDSLKQVLVGAAEAVNPGAVVSTGNNGRAAAPAAASAASAAYEIQYQTVPCITSPSSTFAIWLNVLYLAPLTYLFVSFFIASYLKRTNAQAKRDRVEKAGSASEARRLSDAVHNAEKAGWDAARDLEQEVYGESKKSAVFDEDYNDATPAVSGSPAAARRALRGSRK
jgi:hypothetical protein